MFKRDKKNMFMPGHKICEVLGELIKTIFARPFCRHYSHCEI